MTNIQGRSFKPVYLDHNATSSLAVEIAPLLAGWAQQWGNPSSIHQWGRGPKALIREARQALAQMIGAHPLEVVWTSGGSEANNQAIKGCFAQFRRRALEKNEVLRNEYLMSGVEHPSVAQTMRSLEALGAVVKVIPVNCRGELDLEYIKENLSERTALVSVMYANNETGHIFPIKKIVDMAHQMGALVHCDAVQALGKVPVDVKAWGVDMASFSGHKFYALKGVGALYLRKGTVIESLIHGGRQERSRRAGTENVLAIASLGHMAKQAHRLQAMYETVKGLRDKMESGILQEISGVRVTGAEGARLPNTSSMVIEGVDGETLLMNLDIEGYAVSTGAACSSGSPEPSPVLLAMGLSREEAQSSLRLSLGWTTTDEEVEAFVQTLKIVVSRLRSLKKGEGVCNG